MQYTSSSNEALEELPPKDWTMGRTQIWVIGHSSRDHDTTPFLRRWDEHVKKGKIHWREGWISQALRRQRLNITIAWWLPGERHRPHSQTLALQIHCELAVIAQRRPWGSMQRVIATPADHCCSYSCWRNVCPMVRRPLHHEAIGAGAITVASAVHSSFWWNEFDCPNCRFGAPSSKFCWGWTSGLCLKLLFLQGSSATHCQAQAQTGWGLPSMWCREHLNCLSHWVLPYLHPEPLIVDLG